MKKDYMARLERWARWMLPRQEADDVLADYREIAGDPPRPDGDLLRDLGKPWDVIRPLAEPKAHRTWLAAFAGMAACVLLPGHSGFGWFSWPLFRLCFEQGRLHLGPFLALVGAAAALVWFRARGDEPKAPVPKGLIAALVFLLAWIGLVFLFHWAVLFHLDGFLALGPQVQVWPGPQGVTEPFFVFFSKWALMLLPFFTSFLAVYWLGKARVRDRRWAAAYILTLAAVTISLETVAQLTSMDVTAFEPGLQANLLQCAVIAVLGLAGAGVSLFWPQSYKERSVS